MTKVQTKETSTVCFRFVRFGALLTFLSADGKSIEGDAGIFKVASKPKPRAVLKGKGTDEDLGAGGEELEDADPFGMLYAK
jgi:hypothetical protein